MIAAGGEPTNLGRQGLRASRFGLGTAPLGILPDLVDAAAAQRCLERAADLGIRHLDTAPFYGAGLAEERLGSFLAERDATQFVISTKVGRTVCQSVDGRRATTVFDFSRSGILRQIDESLRRIRVDRLDIVYLHDPDDHWPEAIDEAWPVLAELRAAGLITSVGAGMNQAGMLRRFVQETSMDVILLANRYTLLQQYEADALFADCAARGVSVVLGAVLNGGILATGAVPGASYEYQPASASILERVARIEAVCRRHGVPLPGAALQFAAAHPAVSSVLVGAKSAEEVTLNLDAARYPTPSAFWAELQDLGLVGADRPLPP
ncbi:aldo/keto reductase [Dactylosporangium sp. NPDC005572]|uniref:aldo/keto reductase n=1 Tax=Dactylosporangium sp. NPDC005572 TaxID=3156889 RepID=UPI0033A681DB